MNLALTRGDSPDISREELCREIHSALIQVRNERSVSSRRFSDSGATAHPLPLGSNAASALSLAREAPPYARRHRPLAGTQSGFLRTVDAFP